MAIKTRKIGIIGAGNVGSHLALQFAVQGLADEVVFYDINNDKAHGESHALLDAVSYQPHHFEAYAGPAADMKDADILINASGTPRLPGQTRLDMMDSAVATSKEFIPLIKESRFDGIIISISNPCDIIAEYLQYKLDWPKEKIIGSGTGLDSARLQMQLKRAQARLRKQEDRELWQALLQEEYDKLSQQLQHYYASRKRLLELRKRKALARYDRLKLQLEYRALRDGFIAGKRNWSRLLAGIA